MILEGNITGNKDMKHVNISLSGESSPQPLPLRSAHSHSTHFMRPERFNIRPLYLLSSRIPLTVYEIPACYLSRSFLPTVSSQMPGPVPSP